MIGSLMYLTASRPDIMFAVCAYARFQVTSKASHLNAVKRIFRYLKHQLKICLWYPRDSPFEFEAYSDSDYGGASLDRKSTTGGCQFLGRRLISWQCKKQTIVANSTTKAEYVAAANCCGQVLWIQNQMMDYGFNFMNTKIHIDNESTISVIKNPVAHSRTKHIEIRFHFIRDCYEKRLIEVIKIHTDSNVADLLTKGFDVTRFNFLVVSIGMISMDLRMDRSCAANSTHIWSVKTLEVALKRKSKKVIVSESEGEEPEDQGRIIQDIDDDPLVSLVRESMKEKLADFVTPTKASGEAQEEEISPTILEAAKTLSKVASQGVSKAKSTDKGKRYRRRARSMAKNINTGLDAEDGDFNTVELRLNFGIEMLILGQREGKAQMVEEDIQATHKTKEQIRQEEAGLEEAIRLQAQMDEEVAKQIHLDKMFYTEDDWGHHSGKTRSYIRVVKSLQGESVTNDDFAKRTVEMINGKKKFYAEQKAKAKRLSFEEWKNELKVMKSIESFVPMGSEERVKRQGIQLEQETSKKQKIDTKGASITKEKDKVVKDEEAETHYKYATLFKAPVLVTPGSVVVTPGSVVVTPGSVITTGSILVTPGSVMFCRDRILDSKIGRKSTASDLMQ
ncbi:hypothetical protein Tco_0948380 [Tanacetum coccineum]